MMKMNKIWIPIVSYEHIFLNYVSLQLIKLWKYICNDQKTHRIIKKKYNIFKIKYSITKKIYNIYISQFIF